MRRDAGGEVEPGEIVTISDEGVSSRHFAHKAEQPAHCVFEHVYFANPASVVFGQNVQSVREMLGETLANEAGVPADYVMPMPDSGGRPRRAMGGRAASRIAEGIVPLLLWRHAFIKPTQTERQAAVRLKLNVIAEIVKGKRIVVVDDSIVRGTTTKAKMDPTPPGGARKSHSYLVPAHPAPVLLRRGLRGALGAPSLAQRRGHPQAPWRRHAALPQPRGTALVRESPREPLLHRVLLGPVSSRPDAPVDGSHHRRRADVGCSRDKA